MPKTLNFTEWKKTHPEFKQNFPIQKEGKHWGKTVVEWREIKSAAPSESDPTRYDITDTLVHKYLPCIDTRTGDIYSDCSKKKIFVKHLALLVTRPVHSLVKTLYHTLFFISLPIEILQTYRNMKLENSGKNITFSKRKFVILSLVNCAKSLADIVRTPAYFVALEMVHLAAILLAPIGAFKPSYAYEMRKTAGKIEKSLCWGATGWTWTGAVCFQPLTTVDTLNEYQFPSIARDESGELSYGTYYGETPSAIEIGMTNHAAGQVLDRRKHYNPFYQLIGKLDPNKQYISPAYHKRETD